MDDAVTGPAQGTVGYRMIVALQYVNLHPGCRKMACATAIGPNRSNRYGDAAVMRCVRRGLIDMAKDKRGWTSLTITDRGRAVIGR